MLKDLLALLGVREGEGLTEVLEGGVGEKSYYSQFKAIFAEMMTILFSFCRIYVKFVLI